MATRYWVLGSGTWDASNTTNWSTSSGGSGGASVPSNLDNVIFDVNSGTSGNTVTCSGSTCAGFKYDAAATVVITGSVTVYGTFETYSNNSTALSTLQVNMNGAAITTALNAYVQQITFFATTTASGNVYTRYANIPGGATLDLNSNSLKTNDTQISGTISNGTVYFSGLDSTYKTLYIYGSAAWSTVTIYVETSTYQPVINVDVSTYTNAGDITFTYAGTSTVSALRAKNITINAGTLSLGVSIYAYGSFYLASSATLSTASSRTVFINKASGSPTATRTLRAEGTLSNTGRISFTINAGADTINVTGSNFGLSTYTINNLTVQSAANFTCANVHTRTFSVYASVACDISALSGIYTSNFSNSSISLLPGACTLYFKDYASYGTAFFTAGVVTYNAVTVADVIPLQFTGAAVMNTLTCSTTLGQGTGRGLLFDPGYVYTVNTTFTLSGASSSDRVTLSVTSGTTPATLSKASGTVTAAYANISYSTATGGATFKAPLTTNVNGGGNTGWIFAVPGAGNFFSFF